MENFIEIREGHYVARQCIKGYTLTVTKEDKKATPPIEAVWKVELHGEIEASTRIPVLFSSKKEFEAFQLELEGVA